MTKIKKYDRVQLAKQVPKEYEVLRNKTLTIKNVRRQELKEFVEVKVSTSSKIQTLSIPRRCLEKL